MSLEVSALRALAHPVRLRILSLLTGTELCAADIARELDITQANASYHLRRLADAGEVVEAGVRPVRGGMARLYRHPWKSRHVVVSDPVHEEQFVQVLAAELVRRHAARRGRGRRTMTDAELWVRPEDWAEVVDQVVAASSHLHDVAHPPRTAGAVPVSMSAALFELRRGAEPDTAAP
jgi:DNA-binding transcriptional ArsR family regulator